MSTRLRQGVLRALQTIGVKSLHLKSGLGYDYVCYIGDSLGENPFYSADIFRLELAACRAWLSDTIAPVVVDVGAHVGFFCTHLAQMLSDRSPKIYAFEAAPKTFVKLVKTIEALGLMENVRPISAAVLDSCRPVRLTYSDYNSQFTQISSGTANPRVGEQLVEAAGISLDSFCEFLRIKPSLMKIDVEGSEPLVLAGARKLLKSSERPALCLEYNPLTLDECGSTGEKIAEMLSGYRLFYLNNFEGRPIPPGSEILKLANLDHACNLFAVSREEDRRGNEFLKKLSAMPADA